MLSTAAEVFHHPYSPFNAFVRYLKHQGNNSTLITSVTIRVTPIIDNYTSWTILWICFAIASILAWYQVATDRKNNNIHPYVVPGGANGEASNAGGVRSGHHVHHHHAHHHHSQMNHPNIHPHEVDMEQGGVTTAGAGESEGGISTADTTRGMFRKLLLAAMICRMIAMPTQIYTYSLWVEFICDTLPEMIFASAWTLLVSFFIQLVGVASGTGTNTSPGIVIQLTAWGVYVIMVSAYFWNNLASVLLYALLCCIYAALFGTVVYFCPKLLMLLYPSLQRHSGLAIRLAICTFLCILVFGTRTVFFARNIVAPPTIVYWWVNYGILELLPSVAFLIMMHPTNNSKNNSTTTTGQSPPTTTTARTTNFTIASGTTGGSPSNAPASLGGISAVGAGNISGASIGGIGSNKSSRNNLHRVNSSGSAGGLSANNTARSSSTRPQVAPNTGSIAAAAAVASTTTVGTETTSLLNSAVATSAVGYGGTT